MLGWIPCKSNTQLQNDLISGKMEVGSLMRIPKENIQQ